MEMFSQLGLDDNFNKNFENNRTRTYNDSSYETISDIPK